MSSGDTPDWPVSEAQLDDLNPREADIYGRKLARFAEWLSSRGKDPVKQVGYSDGTVTERISRFQRLVAWLWEHNGVRTEITTVDADAINTALFQDAIRTRDGDPFADTSKRKFNDVLRNWFEFCDTDWNPPYTFTDNQPNRANKPDPFTRAELKQLWDTSLAYKSIPAYGNLQPNERDRWKAHIAQELGKPKPTVTPEDWDKLNRSWKIPSLIRINRGHGLRPDLISRANVDWYDSEDRIITIPAGEAPKNDVAWTIELIDEEAHALEQWLAQRELMTLYDDRPEIWLTRKGNPYSSGSLNDLLDNLLDDADIDARGRKLVWYSFRHSVGTYVYAEYKDLRLVAEQLRQITTSAAAQYVHAVPEEKREAARLL